MNIPMHSTYSRDKSEKLFNLIKWQEYNREAFESALKENKPIFLVISAPAWCHWCHVYESEDFLFHETVHPYINQNFIPVFVDSDKRPDLLKKLEGGWPSTIILAPNRAKLLGFSGPCEPSLLRKYCEEAVLTVVSKNFDANVAEQRSEILCTEELSVEKLEQIEKFYLEHLKNAFDNTFGGFVFGSEQKFPTGLIYDYLLNKYEETKDESYVSMLRLTFDNQYTDIKEIKTKYRLFDPVEGGFHRYSTQIDWTVPHYEKLLYDQAILIKVYARLAKRLNSDKIRNAVNLSVSFVLQKLADTDGGFYNSQDADKEEAYYGEVDRAKLLQPFIDKTIKIEGNALMTSTFLHLQTLEQNNNYKQIALKNLDFLQEKMFSANGAFYYHDVEQNKSFLTGLAISNAHFLLAFVEAYELLKDEKYKKIAEQSAEFCIQNLYDKEKGGFFVRKSKELELYAPDEENDLSKNFGENILFAYAFLRFYIITKEKKYLDTALKTLYVAINIEPSNLDEVAHLLKSIDLIKTNSLLSRNQNRVNNSILSRP